MKLSLFLLTLLTFAYYTQAFDFSAEDLKDSAISFIDLVLNQQKNEANESCTESCCASLPTRAPMTYHYYQNTGRFVGGKGDYKINTIGYSGQGEGYNNPAKQCEPYIGPIPATTYKLIACVNVMHQTVDRPCAFWVNP